jgi:hypothetical protein
MVNYCGVVSFVSLLGISIFIYIRSNLIFNKEMSSFSNILIAPSLSLSYYSVLKDNEFLVLAND